MGLIKWTFTILENYLVQKVSLKSAVYVSVTHSLICLTLNAT